ncbi:hypothetical protein NHH03_10085 [Stieleria sp. TO1_6]|uniref:hypothetical protein n=1 Tax=Stieleria tagensis TaxID=2956795 RepID=UPI00209B5A65|nr:hypothetical protein [Stieleria tagensis]MCO8122087.1 hypothetical protein [Stieleria tagensis]
MTTEMMTNQLQMQPTFRVELPVDMEQAKLRLRQAIQTDELVQHADSAGWVFDYKIEPAERRFWSPHLSVQLNRCEDALSTEAFCRFSPRPEIWTMVMAIYMVAAFCLSAAMIFGFVQWMMGNPPWALLCVPIGIAVILGLHLASLLGQSWSHDQMQLLRSRWERTLEIAFDDIPTTER